MKRTVNKIIAAILSIMCVLCTVCLLGCNNNKVTSKTTLSFLCELCGPISVNML